MEENKCLPFVSTIIVVRNEREYIEKSLMSLINQDYPKERYEIIIVDDCSNDDTVNIIRKIQDERIYIECNSIKEVKEWIENIW